MVTPAAWQISRMEQPAYPFRAKSSVAAFSMPSRAHFIGTLLYRPVKKCQDAPGSFRAPRRPLEVYAEFHGLLWRHPQNCAQNPARQSGDLWLGGPCRGTPGNGAAGGVGSPVGGCRRPSLAPGARRGRQDSFARRGGLAPENASRIGGSRIQRGARRHETVRVAAPPLKAAERSQALTRFSDSVPSVCGPLPAAMSSPGESAIPAGLSAYRCRTAPKELRRPRLSSPLRRPHSSSR